MYMYSKYSIYLSLVISLRCFAKQTQQQDHSKRMPPNILAKRKKQQRYPGYPDLFDVDPGHEDLVCLNMFASVCNFIMRFKT